MNAMWESKEIKQVWAPEKRYAVNTNPVDGYWVAFFRNGKPAGILSTDGTTSLSFRGQGGETDLATEATELIQICADMDMSPRDGFTTVKLALEQEHGLTSEKTFGPIPEDEAPDDTSYTISVDNNKVVALVEESGDSTKIRVGGEWEDTTSDDPRVFDIALLPVTVDAIQLWDDGKTKLSDYAGVLLD
jgi:hypothetical protein